MKHLGDITKIKGCAIPPVDVAVGGSPCQDLSIAGKRAGLDGARSGLYMDQIRVIKELRHADKARGRTGQLIRPRFMVWENVLGAFSSNGGEDFRVVLEEAARVVCPVAVIPGPPGGKWKNAGCILGNGWSIAWRVLDAQFWGVPQRRRRIALVVDFGGHAAPEILFVRKSVCGDIEQGGAAGKTVTGGLEAGAGGAVTLRMRTGCEGRGKGALIQADRSGTFGCHNDQTLFCAAFMGGQGAKAGGIAYTEEGSPTLKSSPSGGNTVPCVFENHGQDCRLKGPLTVAPTVSRTFGAGGNNTPLVMATGQGGAEVLEDCSTTLNCNHEQPIVAHALKAKANLDFREDSDTLVYVTEKEVAGMDCRNGTENAELSAALQAHGNGGYSLNCTHPVRVGRLVRRLTPLECERLQGYPDGWTDVGPWVDNRGKLHKESSDSARYQALGNSIALPPWTWVMKRIAACYERFATLGSFFDGIGGFPLIWERLNGPGSCLWGSEIEEFPMAVTRARFAEGEA